MTKPFYLTLVLSICLFSCNRVTHDYKIGEILYAPAGYKAPLYENTDESSKIIKETTGIFYQGFEIVEIVEHYKDKTPFGVSEGEWLKVNYYYFYSFTELIKYQGFVKSGLLQRIPEINDIRNLDITGLYVNTQNLHLIKLNDIFEEFDLLDTSSCDADGDMIRGKFTKTRDGEIVLEDGYSGRIIIADFVKGNEIHIKNYNVSCDDTQPSYKLVSISPETVEELVRNEERNKLKKTGYDNEKPLLKVSALRSLYLGGEWYDLKNKLGEPDEEYRLGTSMYSSYVYYNSSIDDYYGKPQHIAVMVSPQGIITQIWYCEPGKKLQISQISSISTPK